MPPCTQSTAGKVPRELTERMNVTMDKNKNQDTKAPAKSATPAAGAQPEEGQIRVNWDTSKLTSTYANVANVSSTREEVTLLFGTNQTVTAGAGELTVELTNRLVLSPYAAKRLQTVLQNVIGAYEDKFGPLNLDAGSR